MNKLLIQTLKNQPGFRSYSGRGMMGKKCVGITCKNASVTVLEIVSDMLDNLNLTDPDLLQSQEDSYQEYDNALEDVYSSVNLLKKHNIDSMGLGQILYFPNIPWDESYVENDN